MALSCYKKVICIVKRNIVNCSYCLNYLHSFRTENELKEHENICKNYDYCYIEMPENSKNILKYNQGEKSIKIQFMLTWSLYLRK